MAEEQTLLDAAREAVRRSTDTADAEITGLLRAGIADMQKKGIVMETKSGGEIDETAATDAIKPLLLRSLMLYCQYGFGKDGDVAKNERLERIYRELTNTLALSEDYNGGGVTDG